MLDQSTTQQGLTVPSSHQLSAGERELLGLLARGCTDEGAARVLGVSSRTVRRMIAEIARLAGTTGRFQLGAVAERLGWLERD